MGICPHQCNLAQEWKEDHLTCPKHLDAIASLPAPDATPVAAGTQLETWNPVPAQRATFGLASMFAESDSDNDRSPRPHTRLQDIMMDGDQFYDLDRNQMFFSAGMQHDWHTECQELIDGIRNLDYYDHTVFGKMSSRSAGEDLTMSDAMAALVDMSKNKLNLVGQAIDDPTGLESDEEDEEEAEYSHNYSEWSPHGSKAMFMLDLLDNLAWLRLSDNQLKTIIWVMHECRTPDVPLFSALRKKQAQLPAKVNIKTTRHVSAFGNEFYMNHPAELLALDWANPLVREFIQV
ncbi:hypothetical protein B0H17DRAFT_1143991 [Mycena rosella]|uniref:Uncharacterized protein n=1 Tax=Mycena rosella TaxID=1033263 RepID=A0AAD7CUH5_MYCRO|nr:hypothetical protein B0H17DRAFT_1143991 [Mycena rosella]